MKSRERFLSRLKHDILTLDLAELNSGARPEFPWPSYKRAYARRATY